MANRIKIHSSQIPLRHVEDTTRTPDRVIIGRQYFPNKKTEYINDKEVEEISKIEYLKQLERSIDKNSRSTKMEDVMYVQNLMEEYKERKFRL